MGDMTKRCPRCRTEKNLDEFGRDKSTRDGRCFYCRECRSKIKAWKYDPEKSRERYFKNRDRVKERSREYRIKNPQKIKADRINRAFNISLEEYHNRLALQHNRCWICGRTAEESHAPLGLDHDHATGILRAFLCCECNLDLDVYENRQHKFPLFEKYLMVFRGARYG
jgi:hypothetical protein